MNPAATLGTTEEIRQAGATPSPAARPVRLRGVVTFVHATLGTFFLHDSSGQVAVGLADKQLPLPAVGDRVAIVGLTAPDHRPPLVRASAIATEDRGPLPFAPEITFAEGLGAPAEHQWVRIRGQLLHNESLPDWQRLTLSTPDGEFTVSIPAAERIPSANGAALLVHGVCHRWFQPNSATIGGFFLYSPSPAEVRPIEASTDEVQALTQIVQLRRLRTTEADAGRPVLLHGVVTFAHPDQRILYLNDDTGGALVWLERSEDPLPAVGTAVSVQGVTSSGTPFAGVRAARIEATGLQPLPAPRPISLERAKTGAEDSQWVEMRGHLRQIDALGGWLRLFLTTATGEITVSIPQASATEARIGSFLVVRGVCQSWTNEHNRIGGFFLYTPSTADLTVAEPPPADPFAVPEESIAGLALYRPETLEMQQVRLSGTVLHHLPGHYVVVQNDSGVVRAFSRALQPLLPGERVEIAGVPGRQGNRNVLRGAVYRRLTTGPAPVPIPLPDPPRTDPSLDGHLVSLTARLANLTTRLGDNHLLLETGGVIVPVDYPGSLPAATTRELRAGSKVAVAGLYSLEYDEDEKPSTFSVQLRSPADIVLLEPPPWWTARRALSALSTIGLCLGLGLVWLAVLRRQVQRQTVIIRRQMDTEATLNARHREIVENASDFIFSTDLAGRLTSFNPAGERMTGYSTAAALQLGLGDLIDSRDTATAAAFLAQAKLPANAPAAHLETRLRTRDEHTVHVEISARPIRGNDRVSGLLGVARDITARKQMEELNRQVQKAESLGRMAAAIAHHFNNQIQVVLMGLEMVRLELPKDPSAIEILATAERSARQAAEIGSLLLTYLGQSTSERTTFDLAASCRRSLSLLRSQPSENRRLEEIIPVPGPTICADVDQIQRALRCLMTNAEEALEARGGAIRVEVATVEPGAIPTAHRVPIDFEPLATSYACLSVADTGCGISEQDLGKIFDPFFTTKFHGRGTGLSVVLGVARAHDGAVVVDSQLGQGSRFRVYFPLAAGTDLAPAL